MENGLSGWTKNKRFPGIHIHGPKKDEFISIADSLLNGILPNGWEWVNSSSNTIVARRLAPSAYYKEFLKKSPFEGLKNIFRGNRSKRARLNREILIGKGFHSPTIYCWGRKRGRPFFFTEGVDALGVGIFIHNNWKLPLSGEKRYSKRIIIEKFGQEIGRLHKAGIYHADLRLNNILIQHNKNKIKFYLIDNESIYCFKRIPRRLIEKNLIQVNMIFPLYVTRQDRLRFFNSYNKVYNRFLIAEQRVLIKRVQSRTLKRLLKIMQREKMTDKLIHRLPASFI